MHFQRWKSVSYADLHIVQNASTAQSLKWISIHCSDPIYYEPKQAQIMWVNTKEGASTLPNIHQYPKTSKGCLPLQKKPATLGRSENTLRNCCVGPSHPWSAGKLHHEKEMMQKSAALRTYHTCFSYTYKRACYKDVHWDKQTQKVPVLYLGWATHLRMYPMPNDYFKKGPHFHCHTQTC